MLYTLSKKKFCSRVQCVAASWSSLKQFGVLPKPLGGLLVILPSQEFRVVSLIVLLSGE